MIERLRRALGGDTDVAGLATFRILFGLMVAVSALRFIVYGWVDLFFVRPTFHFHYLGLEAVKPLGAGGMHALFVALIVLGLCITAGLLTRVACALFFIAFTYVQLIDVATYLNHYVLVSLLALLLALTPSGAAWSIDARLFPRSRRAVVPAWCLWLLRFQVGLVYTFAGLAKVGEDWLVHAQPLSIWLASRTHVPWLGPLFTHPVAPYAASWAGCLFDLTIVLWLSWRRTRAVAYVAVLVFHAATSALFPIGMFPVIMVIGATVFFDPSWPRRLAARLPVVGRRLAGLIGAEGDLRATRPSTTSLPSTTSPPSTAAVVAFGAFALLQLLVPLRAHAYRGNVLWHEQGMRLSWRVMVREKNASVTYLVSDPISGRTWQVPPRAHLQPWQEREFATQPDLLLQLGQHIGRVEAARVGHTVEVRVDATASLNGRRRARLIDPRVNLTAIQDSIAPATWILPEPMGTPPSRVASR